MKFTIFTPTYNRAYVLNNLYQSLCKQTCKDFEWIIVDDGSTDNTAELCASFTHEEFSVKYIKVPNQGKHVAINTGAKIARGKWFFIVDSDDWLPEDSISKFLEEEKNIVSPKVGVLCGMRYNSKGARIGGDISFKNIECTPFYFRYTMKVKGDLAEAILTSVLREYPFPVYEDETFCPEALLFNRIAKKYLTHYFNENVYFCEYLSDGLSAHITRMRMKNWRASTLCYAEQAECQVPVSVKIRSWINYWRFKLCAVYSGHNASEIRIPLIAHVFAPIGLFFHIKDKIMLGRDK